ncbi:unnamed protein product [Prunus armeniaca]
MKESVELIKVKERCMAMPVLVGVQKGGLATGPPHLEYPSSFVLWPLAGTQPPVSGLTFWNQT